MAFDLLGRHIRKRPEQHADTGERRACRHRAAGKAWRSGFGGHTRQAEVEHFDARLRQHHVRGLEVPVNDAGLVRGRERAGQLGGDGERLTDRQTLRRSARTHASGDARGERLAVQELHDQIGHSGVVPDVVDRADVRVGQRGDRSGLAIEALPAIGVVVAPRG